MTEQQANDVYDLLVQIGGAYEPDRQSFVYAHVKDKYPCTEWRFSGYLGFGGKYRSGRNSVDCYREDETAKRLAIIEELNSELSELPIDTYK